MAAGHFSIQEFFKGSAVLITGASGYVGALTLERLLRCTDVSNVYVLMRGKRGQGAQARLAQLLDQPLMHLLRGNPVLNKVVAVAGDICAGPGLGISPEDLRVLQREVNTVIHCAADIRLEAGIQDLLRSNYEGTRHLLDLARSFTQLRSFVHVSSAYTNMNVPHGSLVKESIYRLTHGDAPVNDQELAKELLALPAHTANLRAEGLLAQWNFPNPYTLSKHLAEYMVADYQKYFDIPIAIVRPTLISSVARDPYPGYTGNLAGHVGAVVAFWAGLFSHPSASNYKASNVWDVIPSDVVANVILAAAAAVGQGLAADCIATPAALAPEDTAVAGASAAVATAATPQGLGPKALASGSLINRVLQKPQQKHKQHQHQLQQGRALNSHHEPQPQQQPKQPLLIVHCGSSTLYPLSIMESWNIGVEVLGAWPKPPNMNWAHCAPPLGAKHEPNAALAAVHMWVSGLKIWLAATLLRWMKHERVARKIEIGFESFKVINQPKLDVDLRFSTNNMQRLAALLDPAEADEFLLLWRPATATATGTGTISSLITPSKTAGMQGLSADGHILARRPSLLAAQAGKLAVLPVHSSSSSSTSLQSSDSFDDADVAIDDTASDSDSGSGSSNSNSSACDGDDCPTPFADPTTAAPNKNHQKQQNRQVGAVLTAAQREEVKKMRQIPIQWRAFHINLGVFIYCTVFNMPMPPKAAPITRPQIARWLKVQPNDMVVEHSFNLYG